MIRKILFTLVIGFTLASCAENCPDRKFKYEVGEDVRIKNKDTHNTAVITKQIEADGCSCEYEVSYYSMLNTRRHRVVTEGEIEHNYGGEYKGNDSDSSAKEGILQEIKELF